MKMKGSLAMNQRGCFSAIDEAAFDIVTLHSSKQILNYFTKTRYTDTFPSFAVACKK